MFSWRTGALCTFGTSKNISSDIIFICLVALTVSLIIEVLVICIPTYITFVQLFRLIGSLVGQ